jgi:hypothetical protein
MVTQLDLDRAVALGTFAARRRLDVTSCPWKGSDPRARALGYAWMNAYLHRRPPFDGVDYDG